VAIRTVIHGLRGKPSKRKIAERVEQDAVKILSAPVYENFGPTLASEYLGSKHGIKASKETVRQRMLRAKLWRGKKQKVQEVHLWRPRRNRVGELVQWDTSEHDWLERRGEKLYLIVMIDDASSHGAGGEAAGWFPGSAFWGAVPGGGRSLSCAEAVLGRGHTAGQRASANW
jgi:hypothetical protein